MNNKEELELLKIAFEAGADESNWTKVTLSGKTIGSVPVFEDWYKKYMYDKFFNEEQLKAELIVYLSEEPTCDVQALWALTKNYYEGTDVVMGGGYISSGSSISVVLNDEDQVARFKVSLEEVAAFKK